MKLLLSEILKFDKKKRIELDELKEKVKNMNKFDNYRYSLESKIDYNIKNKVEFSDFDVNNLLKQIIKKNMIKNM